MRKLHNREPGYIAERRNPLNPMQREGHPSKVVIYEAEPQGLDVAPDKYAVVCDAHGTLCGTSSVAKARVLMKAPENFCEECADILRQTTANEESP